MAFHEINNATFEVPDNLKGEELANTLETIHRMEYRKNRDRFDKLQASTVDTPSDPIYDYGSPTDQYGEAQGGAVGTAQPSETPLGASPADSPRAIYEINGAIYELPNDLQGEQLTDTLKKLQAISFGDNVASFLDFLGKAEGADYDIIVGGKQRISDYSQHPGIVGLTTADGPSTAAGKYQITKTTYDDFAPRLGITDFSPESQDKIAKAIIEQAGVLGAVEPGDFATAIGKLGGRWASLPSSKYKQGKRSQEWVDKYFKNPQSPAGQPQSQPQGTPEQPSGSVYKPFANVRKDIDPTTLNNDPDWLAASQAMYRMRNRKDFQGSPEDLAAWGKSFMGDFNFNMVQMGIYAHSLNKNGSQEDKQAFLYMMDTYDNTNFSWEGAGRAAIAIATDPLTWAGTFHLELPKF